MFKLISATFFRQVLAGVLQLSSLVLIARFLSITEMGQYTIVILIPTLLSQILTLGLQSANIYGIGRKLIKAEHVVYINLVLILGLSIIGTILTVVVLSLFHNLLFPSVPSSLLILACLTLIPSTYIAVLPSIFQALQNFIVFNITCLLQPFFLLICVVIAILISNDVYTIVLAYIAANSISFLIIIYFLIKEIKPERYSILNFYNQFIGYSLRSHLSNVLTLLNYRSSILIISYFTSPALVSVYTVSMQLTEKLWLPSQAASTILLPKISSILDENESEAAKLTIDTARLVLMVTLIIAICFIFILPFAINFLFGVKYQDSILVSLILLPGILAWTPSRVIASDIAARGMAHINLKIAYNVLAVNILLSIFLVMNFQVIGAAIATTLAYTSDLFFRLYHYKKITRVAVSKLLRPKYKDLILIMNTVKGFI